MTFQVGQKVQLKSTGEKGVVVWIWQNESGDAETYVAFFGEKFPEGQPEQQPYILRYYSSSLVVVD